MPIWWFLLRGISYPRQCLGCQCELFVVCVYVFCVFGQEPPTLTASTLPSAIIPTLDPVETMAGPSNKHYWFACTRIHEPVLCNSVYMVDLAGVEPASRILFLITVYAVLVIIYLFDHDVNHYDANGVSPKI